jgi:hypothetical protein
VESGVAWAHRKHRKGRKQWKVGWVRVVAVVVVGGGVKGWNGRKHVKWVCERRGGGMKGWNGMKHGDVGVCTAVKNGQLSCRTGTVLVKVH